MTTKTKDPITHRAVRVGRLETIGQMKSEVGRILREMRRGTLATSDGMRMAQVLMIMMTATRDLQWEQKIMELEERSRADAVPLLEVIPRITS